MIRYYFFDGLPALIGLSFSLNYPDFTVLIDVLAPGILIGPGLWTRDMIARVAAPALSVIWALHSTLVATSFLVSGSNVVAARGAIYLALLVAFALYSGWQFSVLRSDKVRELFEAPY